MAQGGNAERVEGIDVGFVARLVRLDLTEEETQHFQAQLDMVLGYVREIGELDLTAIEPTSHARFVTNVFREDVERAGLDREVALRNAPDAQGDLFGVPRILE